MSATHTIRTWTEGGTQSSRGLPRRVYARSQGVDKVWRYSGGCETEQQAIQSLLVQLVAIADKETRRDRPSPTLAAGCANHAARPWLT